MSNNHMEQTAQRMAQLRDHFIHHDRFAPLGSRFMLLTETRLAQLDAGRRGDADGIALTGASGTGKTAAVEQLLKQGEMRLAASEHRDKTIISLRVPSPATLKFVGQTLLRALGFQISSERQAWYIWDLVRHHLKERKVLFAHLDEAQHLASHGTKHELNSVASMLKTLMTDREWPVSVILSGTCELENILNHDPQLARRLEMVHFGSMSPVVHGNDVLDLLENYCKRARLVPDAEVLDLMHAERLIHAAANQFGLVIELILTAIEQAFLEDAQRVTHAHFVQAYHLRTACEVMFNPFLVPDFFRIDARKVFTREVV